MTNLIVACAALTVGGQVDLELQVVVQIVAVA